ncbi:MAG TPA: hypothetical protein VM884_00005, partial [Flavisolibacter sp.]|nr:hypothetical protein [Flavisolibacter sp.]
MMDPKNFERDIDGKQTRLLTLKNDKGLEVMISNYGARIISLHFDGVNVTPGFPSLDAYASHIAPYHGATVGRYANRIADGKFTLNGRNYSLQTNNTPNHLHGGLNGFHRQVWEVENSYQNSVVLSYLSEDGEEGYPGAVKVSVSYSLSAKNELI